MMFNVNRLAAGRKEVEELYELAEMLGLEIIKINGKKISSSLGSVSGFEIARMGFNPRGGMGAPVMDKGYVYMYPDKHGTRWGFVLDTDHNRRVLASHIAAPILNIVDAKVKKEIIAYCDENGINVVPQKKGNPYAKKSIGEQQLENRNNKLEADLRMMKEQMRQLEEAKAENDEAMLRKEQYRDKNSDNTVTELHANEITGEAEEVEVEATTVALDKPAVKKTKTSKADAPLAGKKIKKK